MDQDPSQPNRLTTITDITRQLLEKGFTEDFIMSNDDLKAKSTGDLFKPSEVQIVKHYREEGTTDPADMSIVYAVETSNGIKGTIVVGYGPNSDTPFSDFMQKVEELPNQNNPNGNNHQVI